MASSSNEPTRTEGAELPLGERYALAIRVALEMRPDSDRIPYGKGSELAAEFGVSTKAVRELWSRVKKQLKEGRSVDLSSKPRSGRPQLLTPTKETALVEANAANRRGTVRQVHRKVAESGVGVSHSSIFRWLKTMGAVYKRRWIKPSLTFNQMWTRILFVINQVDEASMRFLASQNVVHVDETWFYLMVDGEQARYFPKEVVEDMPVVQHKSHIPKVMFIVANARPDPSHQFDGKIGIWRISKEKVAERAGRYHEKGEKYEADV